MAGACRELATAAKPISQEGVRQWTPSLCKAHSGGGQEVRCRHEVARSRLRVGSMWSKGTAALWTQQLHLDGNARAFT